MPPKSDYPTYTVNLRLSYQIRAKDEMQALNNILKTISLLKLPGVLIGAVKWHEVKLPG